VFPIFAAQNNCHRKLKIDFTKEIERCIAVLKNGGTILYPTDTIWGIGCDATNVEAVKKIFKIKQRDENKSMIVLLDDESKLIKYMKEIPSLAFELIEYSVKPLTIIYPDALNLAKNVIAQDGSIAIRIVKDDFCKQLIRKFNKPIVSTSANVSGDDAPQQFSEIKEEIKSSVDYVVNLPDKKNSPTVPSSIIKLEVDGRIKIIRK
jgi:L-threonylcarbamoyladenylate synthase